MYPMSVPTNTRPDTTDGWPYADKPVGKPKAHLSLSRGTSTGVIPASFADWKRVLARFTPQPFQAGPDDGSARGGLLAHWFAMLLASPSCKLPSGRPLIKVATIRRWSSLKVSPCPFITPVVSA